MLVTAGHTWQHQVTWQHTFTPVIVGGEDGDLVAGVAVAGTGHVALVDVGEGGFVQDDVPNVIDLKFFSILNL